MRDLKLLYYSNAFISNHGGKLHSEAFLMEARKSKRIKHIEVYPRPGKPKENPSRIKKESLREKLKKNGFLQIFFFFRRNYTSFQEIKLVVKKYKPDALHIRVDSNFLIISQLKNLFPELLITTEVNASPFDENFKNIAFLDFFRKLEAKALRNAHANFFVSDFLRKSILPDYIESRDYVVQNGVNLEMFIPPPVSKGLSSKLTFGYIGTLDFHKNLKNLIDAFYIVKNKFSKEINLIIVGDGPMFSELKEYIESKGLTNSVLLTGWVKHNEIPGYLYKMDVAIHHSANPYMSPLKIFEYMAAGLPVIGPDIPAVKEIFKNGEDIILVTKDTDDLADKMLYLLQNEKKRSHIAEAGKDKILAQYGWDTNVDSILTVIQNKINENY